MKPIETYRKYGLGIDRDRQLNKKEYFTEDVLDMAQELYESAPPLLWSNYTFSTCLSCWVSNWEAS